MLFPKTTKAPFTADRNTEEDDGFWPNLEFATHTIGNPQIGSPLSAAVPDQKLMPDQHGFRNDGP